MADKETLQNAKKWPTALLSYSSLFEEHLFEKGELDEIAKQLRAWRTINQGDRPTLETQERPIESQRTLYKPTDAVEARKEARGFVSILMTAIVAGVIGFGAGAYTSPNIKADQFRARMHDFLSAISGFVRSTADKGSVHEGGLAPVGEKPGEAETTENGRGAQEEKVAPINKEAADKGAPQTNASGTSQVDSGKSRDVARPEEKPAAAPTAKQPFRLDKAMAAAILARLPPKGHLNPAICESALAATVMVEPIQFGIGAVSIRTRSARVLDKLATLMLRCPSAKFEVGGYADKVGSDEENVALSLRRAQRVVDYLVTEGVSRERLTAMGYGPLRPVASNERENGRADKPRIEFTLK